MAKHPNKNRKPPVNLVVRMVGPHMRPWGVPLRTLARVLEATQRLAEPPSDEVPISPAEEDIESEEEKANESVRPILRLIDIKQGSAKYEVAAPSDAVSRLRLAGEGIINPSDADWAASQVRSIGDLSAIARSLGCTIEFIDPSKKDDGVIARISPSTYDEIEGNAFVHGSTTVIGLLERVGGATQLHCGLRLPDQSRMLICKISDSELARQLARYLYQVVTVSGKAQWLRKTWQIKRFEIRSFDGPKTGSVIASLKATYLAGGNAWDKISDPDKYIAEMRG
jgi:hypothetical protein